MAIEGAVLAATLRWAGGERSWGFTGDVAPDAVARIGVLDTTVPDAPGPLELTLHLHWDAGTAANSYTSTIDPPTGSGLG